MPFFDARACILVLYGQWAFMNRNPYKKGLIYVNNVKLKEAIKDENDVIALQNELEKLYI